MSIYGNPVTLGGGDVYEPFFVKSGWKQATGSNDSATNYLNCTGPHFSDYATDGGSPSGINITKDCVLSLMISVKVGADTRRNNNFDLKLVRNGQTSIIGTVVDNGTNARFIDKMQFYAGDHIYGSQNNAYNVITTRTVAAYIVNP